MTEDKLPTWRELLITLVHMSEAEVKDLLDREQAQPHPRTDVLTRLHQRYTMLRSKRERAEIMDGAERVRL